MFVPEHMGPDPSEVCVCVCACVSMCVSMRVAYLNVVTR